MSDNFFEALSSVAAQHAAAPCLIDESGTLSFADLYRRVGQVAGVLLDLGVAPGDRVLAQTDKSPDAVAVYLATLQVGAVFVPLNTAYTDEEIGYFVDDAQPKVFITRAGAVAPEGPVQLTLDGAGSGSLIDALSDGPTPSEIVARTGDDLAAIVYTSGTTGRSKGAMLSHANLATNAHSLRACWGWRDDDVLLHALPIFHVHGLFIALHCALLSGTATIFQRAFRAPDALARIPDATVMMGVPTFYGRLLAEDGLTQEVCAGVRVFICGSAPLTEQTFAAWEARTGHRILERYGMSETIINTSNPLDGQRVPGTVGFPIPDVEVRITDADGAELAATEVGNIEVRGPNVFGGYWRNPEKTAEELRADGWFITGDLGHVDDDGRLTIAGRGKDLIISGGYNVYPKEVERILDEMPEVLESAVIGVPHDDFGEAVVAVVVPAADEVKEPAVRAALAERLARFKQPKAVENVTALPRNAMGKVQKNELRARYTTLFVRGD